MRRPTLDRHTVVGLGGSVLLTAAYLGVGIVRDYSIPAQLDQWLGLLVVALLVGGVVAVAAHRVVPPDQRSRRGHARTALTMAVVPTLVVVGVVAVLFLLAAGLADVTNALEGLAAGSDPLAAGVAFLAIAALIAAIVLVVFIALGVLVGGILLNSSAIAGYALVTLVLERGEDAAGERSTGGDPPEGAG